MHYTNSEMKLDQLIGYFNSRKINLVPPFQRGHVWELKDRQRLLENVVTSRPIPAIFLYKEPDGSQFSYNILDGKQRLESLILFIGTQRKDLFVQNVKDYFFDAKEKKQANYTINFGERRRHSKICRKKSFVNFASTQSRQSKSISTMIALWTRS